MIAIPIIEPDEIGQPRRVPCWQPSTMMGLDAGALAVIWCSNGHPSNIDATVHRIAPDGTVTPSCICCVAGCTFHQNIQLLGWGAPP